MSSIPIQQVPRGHRAPSATPCVSCQRPSHPASRPWANTPPLRSLTTTHPLTTCAAATQTPPVETVVRPCAHTRDRTFSIASLPGRAHAPAQLLAGRRLPSRRNHCPTAAHTRRPPPMARCSRAAGRLATRRHHPARAMCLRGFAPTPHRSGTRAPGSGSYRPVQWPGRAARALRIAGPARRRR